MLKVLVVEDEEMIRRGIVLAVDWAALDCVVVGEASNGLEALEAVERYGAAKGGLLAFKRLLKCQPFRRQKSIEYDPVP